MGPNAIVNPGERKDGPRHEHEEVLAEIGLMHQALDQQASVLQLLTREIISIKDLLSPEIFIQNPNQSAERDAFCENIEEQKKTVSRICSFLTSLLDRLKGDGIKNCSHEIGLLNSYFEELEGRSVGQIGRTSPLSSRESQVMSMIKAGMTTQGIAEQLHISSDTVKTHRRSIRRKLEMVGSKADLASHLRMDSDGAAFGEGGACQSSCCRPHAAKRG